VWCAEGSWFSRKKETKALSDAQKAFIFQAIEYDPTVTTSDELPPEFVRAHVKLALKRVCIAPAKGGAKLLELQLDSMEAEGAAVSVDARFLAGGSQIVSATLDNLCVCDYSTVSSKFPQVVGKDRNRCIEGSIDLTHALISSLPALNRGLYQAVTSARGVLTRCKKAVLGITLGLAGSQSCTISQRRTAEAH
jgi:hypothetical protein